MSQEKKQRRKDKWETGDFVIMDAMLIKIMSDLKITNGKEMMLFCKILSLSKTKEGERNPEGCTAGNKYLSEFLCTTDRNVRNYLEDLKEKNLIKTFEEKEGLRTTKRHIHPQYKYLESLCKGEEYFFLSSKQGAEDFYQTSGTNLPNERKEFTKPEEDTFHHIKDYNILEYNIDKVTDVPKVAYAPSQEKPIHVRYKEIKEAYNLDCRIIEMWGVFNKDESVYQKKQRIARECNVSIDYVNSITKKHKEMGFAAKEMWQCPSVYLKDVNGNDTEFEYEGVGLFNTYFVSKDEMRKNLIDSYDTYVNTCNLYPQDVINTFIGKYDIDITDDVIACN